MKALLTTFAFLILALPVVAEDPGNEAVARLRTVLIFGSDDDISKVVPEALALEKGHVARLKALKGVDFENYAFMGVDEKPVWRSYTNWAEPMKGSQEILLSFEPNSEAGASGVRLDLELWQSKRKVMKTTQSLRTGKWLYIVGPKWRGGRLLLGIELLPLKP
jgi:hypothetical protein